MTYHGKVGREQRLHISQGATQMGIVDMTSLTFKKGPVITVEPRY
jgi:hypothetical protein